MIGKMSEEEFLAEVRKTLDRSTESLDQDTVRRLRQARFEALERPGTGRSSWFGLHRWITAGGLATVTVLALGVSLWVVNPREKLPARHVDEVEMLTAQEHLDLYQDLEFYRWLADSSGTEGDGRR